MKKITYISCLVILFITKTHMAAQDQFRLLLFTHTDPWHQETIPVAIEAFKEMSLKNQFYYEWTINPKDLLTKLPEMDVVVFVNANSEMLNSEQMDSLKSFMNRGGGFVGVHGASASDVRNEWFDKLIGGVFTNHPLLQSGVIEKVDESFPATWHLPEKWLWTDEWYNFDPIFLDAINVVLKVDEGSYDFTLGYDDAPMAGMGEVHPVAWSQEYDGGRSFYTSLGHKPECFSDQRFLDHIYGGIYWVVNRKK